MPDIMFPDVSNFQAEIDWATFRKACGAVASQVSWGTLATSPAGRVAAVRAASFYVTVWYCGLVHGQPIDEQAATAYSQTGRLQPWETVAVDWEATDGVMPTADEAQQMLGALAFVYGRPVEQVGLYGSASLLAANPGVGTGSWRWSASYETPEPATPHTLWQYTNGQYTSVPATEYSPVNWPGIGLCDTSIFHGDVDQMRQALSCAAPAPTPAPAPVPAPDPTEDPMDTAHELTLPGALDTNGNGWYTAAQLGIADVNKIKSVTWILGVPTSSGYGKTPKWGIDQAQQLVVSEGTPGGDYGCILWIAP